MFHVVVCILFILFYFLGNLCHVIFLNLIFAMEIYEFLPWQICHAFLEINFVVNLAIVKHIMANLKQFGQTRMTIFWNFHWLYKYHVIILKKQVSRYFQEMGVIQSRGQKNSSIIPFHAFLAFSKAFYCMCSNMGFFWLVFSFSQRYKFSRLGGTYRSGWRSGADRTILFDLENLPARSGRWFSRPNVRLLSRSQI